MFQIALADAVCYPKAMMVHLNDTSVTLAAVVRSGWFHTVTLDAKVIELPIKVVKL